MPYTTLAKLTARFGENMLIMLTDRADIATGAIDQTTVNQAIDDADALIDGYVGVRYALPMADTPPLIAKLALDLVIYNLHISSADPKVEEDYKAAMSTLKDISAGRVRLPIAGTDAAGTGGSGARVTDRDRTFTENGMKGFIG